MTEAKPFTEKTADAIATHIQGGAVFRLSMIRRGLLFEIRTGGRLTAKAPKCTTILRREFGVTGNKRAQLRTFEEALCAFGVIARSEVTTDAELGQ